MHPSVSMGCMVPHEPASAPPQSIPAETRDRIIGDFLANMPGRPRLAEAAAEYLRGRTEPQFLDLSFVHAPVDPRATFRVIRPLPAWCYEGAVARRWTDDKDYVITCISTEHIWFQMVAVEPPRNLALDRDRFAQRWQEDWRPHPLPPSRWEWLLADEWLQAPSDS